MSYELYVTFEDGRSTSLPQEMDPKQEGLIFGNALPAYDMLLDDLATTLGIRPFSSFVFEQNWDAEEESEPEWHSSAEALNTVSKLLSYILAHPDVDKSAEGAWWGIYDLRALEILLSDAAKDGIRCYFGMC